MIIKKLLKTQFCRWSRNISLMNSTVILLAAVECYMDSQTSSVTHLESNLLYVLASSY